MKKFYFLFAAQILYVRDGLERTRNFNILMTNPDSDTVTRHMLGRVQQSAQVRFFTEFDTERKAQVLDVFIIGTNRLGGMTAEEFHKGFEVPTEENLDAGDRTPPANNAAPEPSYEDAVAAPLTGEEPASVDTPQEAPEAAPVPTETDNNG